MKDSILALGTFILISISGIAVNILTKEAEGLIGTIPVMMLRLARRRLPHRVRADLYDEWRAELNEALHGSKELPLTRLWLGMRYAFGLFKSAGDIGRVLSDVPSRTQQPSTEVEAIPFPATASQMPPPVGPVIDISGLRRFKPETYRDARAIGQAYRGGNPVLMDLSELHVDHARRLVDFSAGLAFASHGTIERVTTRVFLLNPPRSHPEDSALSA